MISRPPPPNTGSRIQRLGYATKSCSCRPTGAWNVSAAVFDA